VLVDYCFLNNRWVGFFFNLKIAKSHVININITIFLVKYSIMYKGKLSNNSLITTYCPIGY